MEKSQPKLLKGLGVGVVLGIGAGLIFKNGRKVYPAIKLIQIHRKLDKIQRNLSSTKPAILPDMHQYNKNSNKAALGSLKTQNDNLKIATSDLLKYLSPGLLQNMKIDNWNDVKKCRPDDLERVPTKDKFGKIKYMLVKPDINRLKDYNSDFEKSWFKAFSYTKAIDYDIKCRLKSSADVNLHY